MTPEARTQARMVPLIGVGAVSNEPALTICNDLLQFLIYGGVGPIGESHWTSHGSSIAEHHTLRHD